MSVPTTSAVTRECTARLATRISAEVATRLQLAKTVFGGTFERLVDQALDKGLPTKAELLSQISDGEPRR